MVHECILTESSLCLPPAPPLTHTHDMSSVVCHVCRSLPWGAVLRVWDMFFFEGPKVLFKVALAILNLSFGSPKAQKQIPGFFELTRALRNLNIDVTHEDILVPEVSTL